jgi:cyclic dehypoxanthinyl futalosine synthase
MEAGRVRRRLHPEGVVTYIIDRNINYTNFCTEYCTFCAFYRPLKGPKLASEKATSSTSKRSTRRSRDRGMGGTGVLMQGGIHPDLKIDWFERLFTGIKQRFPQIWLHCLSAARSGHRRVLRAEPARHHRPPARRRPRFHPRRRRRDSRRRSPPSHRPPQVRTKDWVDVHRTAHQLGMRTTATMMFGVGETSTSASTTSKSSATCRKRPAASPPSSPGASSQPTPRSAAAAGTKPPRRISQSPGHLAPLSR